MIHKLLIFLLFFSYCYLKAQTVTFGNFSELKGDYLGQSRPGISPVIFAPGFISTEKRELNSVFTPDGKEFYFSIQNPGKGYKIYFTKNVGDGWTQPKPVAFSASDFSDVDMCLTPDGKRMYFCSNRPVNKTRQNDFRIWYVERVGMNWSEPVYLDSPINQGIRAIYPTISNRMTIYFQAIMSDSPRNRDIFYAELIDGKYGIPIRLGPEINSEFGEGDGLIAPDERYMIVNSNGRPDDMGNGDLYIAFRNDDGTWTELKNMGHPINSTETDYCPMLSPDEKYFFFTSRRSGNGDIYWVDAKIIEEFNPNKGK